ncbi:MAG: hypothetical protein V4482_02020 [Pseudomonadota bacterium]
MFLRKIPLYIPIFALIYPCIASDGDYDLIQEKIQSGQFSEQCKCEKRRREEKCLIDKFNSNLSLNNRMITIALYEEWTESIRGAIRAEYDVFMQLLATHIENNILVQSVIKRLSFFPQMKDSLVQLSEKIPVLRKYMTEKIFV